jgi:hypothetical protein
MMTALELLRRHYDLDWKKMGREKLKAYLKERLVVIGEEQKKLCARMGTSSVEEMERLFMSGRFRGKEAASIMHQHTRLCSLVRLAEEAMEELEAPDPDAIEDEFEGYRRH